MIRLLILLSFNIYTLNNVNFAHDMSCCLQQPDTCSCPKIELVLKDEKGREIDGDDTCPTRVALTPLKDQTTGMFKVRVTEAIPKGMYTVFGHLPEAVKPEAEGLLTWIAFLGYNIPHSCLAPGKICTIDGKIPTSYYSSTEWYHQGRQLKIFLIKQKIKMDQYDFILSMWASKKCDVQPDGHTLEYSIFRDKLKYDGPPFCGNQYTVVSGDISDDLKRTAKYFDNTALYSDVITFLMEYTSLVDLNPQLECKSCPTFPEFAKIPHATDTTLRYEKLSCSTQIELRWNPVKDSLYHSHDECEAFNLDWLDVKQREEYVSFLREKIDSWNTDLLQEESNLRVVKQWSEKERNAEEYYLTLIWTVYRISRMAMKIQIMGDLVKELTGEWPKIKTNSIPTRREA